MCERMEYGRWKLCTAYEWSPSYLTSERVNVQSTTLVRIRLKTFSLNLEHVIRSLTHLGFERSYSNKLPSKKLDWVSSFIHRCKVILRIINRNILIGNLIHGNRTSHLRRVYYSNRCCISPSFPYQRQHVLIAVPMRENEYIHWIHAGTHAPKCLKLYREKRNASRRRTRKTYINTITYIHCAFKTRTRWVISAEKTRRRTFGYNIFVKLKFANRSR